MRVMVDSNIIISSLVYRSAKMGRVIEHICANHELCLASCCLNEVRAVMAAKFSNTKAGLDEFFANIPYTLIETPDKLGAPLFSIRDNDDYPILYTAIIGQVDLFVTGDRDFFELKIDRPKILMPLDFLANY